MQAAYHLMGGAPLLKRVKIGASIVNAGIPVIDGVAGVIPSTTTDFADTLGLAEDTGTYSTTQGDAEGLVTVSVRPDLVIKALMSGGAAEGTALTTLANTSAETAGTTITDTDVGTAAMASGTIWCIAGANVGQSRTITTLTASTSIAVTVPFKNDIANGDQFLFCPYNNALTGLGQGNVQATTAFYQANAAIAAGTGGVATVVDLELNSATDSYVLFKLGDHVFDISTV